METIAVNNAVSLTTLPMVAIKRFQGVKRWDLESAFAYCEWVTRNHYENFPVGSAVLPKRLRPYVCSVYAFARAADDFADEEEYAGRRQKSLDAWLEALHHENPAELNHPVFIALAETISRFNIPKKLFADLITAFKMDTTKHDYANFKEVLFYCQHSANPVGRIVLYLFGYRDAKLMAYSDAICTALQLANFWQDVAVDLKKPRVYLPKDDMQRFGYSRRDLDKHLFNQTFIELMRFQVERTEELFRDGKSLLPHLSGRLALEIHLTWLGGMTILEKIKKLNYNTLATRPAINTWDKLSLLGRAILLHSRR